jgi:hypothetical protein
MIKGITSTNPHLTVGGLTGDYMNMSTPSAGMVRYNGNFSSLEVYDGSYWRTMHNYQSVDLTPDATEAINWAIKKMLEEDNRKLLAESNPAIKAALENLERAEEQLITTIHLSKEHETTTS